MTVTQQIITIGIVVAGTMLTRFLPFLIFRSSEKAPRYIHYLGKVLAGAVFGLLVIYCLKNVNIAGYPHGLPELISIALVVGLHLWRKNMFISIAAGTVCYMLLVQLVF